MIRYVYSCRFSVGDDFPDIVIMDVNVFGASMAGGITAYGNTSLVVAVRGTAWFSSSSSNGFDSLVANVATVHAFLLLKVQCIRLQSLMLLRIFASWMISSMVPY